MMDLETLSLLEISIQSPRSSRTCRSELTYSLRRLITQLARARVRLPSGARLSFDGANVIVIKNIYERMNYNPLRSERVRSS